MMLASSGLRGPPCGVPSSVSRWHVLLGQLASMLARSSRLPLPSAPTGSSPTYAGRAATRLRLSATGLPPAGSQEPSLDAQCLLPTAGTHLHRHVPPRTYLFIAHVDGYSTPGTRTQRTDWCLLLLRSVHTAPPMVGDPPPRAPWSHAGRTPRRACAKGWRRRSCASNLASRQNSANASESRPTALAVAIGSRETSCGPIPAVARGTVRGVSDHSR